MTDGLWWALVPVMICIAWGLLAVIRTLIAWRKEDRDELLERALGNPETRLYSSYAEWQKDILGQKPLNEIFGRVPEGFFDRPEVKKERERLRAERVARHNPVLAARQRLAEIHKRLISMNGAQGVSGAAGAAGHPGPCDLGTPGPIVNVPAKAPKTLLGLVAEMQLQNSAFGAQEVSGAAGAAVPEKQSVLPCAECGGSKPGPKDWPWCDSCYAKIMQALRRL